ncbi:MAG: dynamin family protein [Paracoccaceae bacterium]
MSVLEQSALTGEPSVEAQAKPLRLSTSDAVEDSSEQTRLPRVCLMGEFSAGKSTLSNLLIGAPALPVNVTATQLPPVWISHGTDAPYRAGLDGETTDVDLENLEDVNVEDTGHIRIFNEAKFLKMCDLIDMPGISDPNMAADVWQRMIHHADIVIWCSHATQAWRQSEAAVWSHMPKELHEKSILLLTRMDRILSERDRGRVVKRVQKEAGSMFREILPVSLIKAVEAGEDPQAWEESGAGALLSTLSTLVGEVANGEMPAKSTRVVSRVRSAPAPVGGVDASLIEENVEPTRPARIVMPTRIRPRPLGNGRAAPTLPDD